MNYPDVNELAAFKLSANALEKVSGGAGGITDAMRYRTNIIYGLVWATNIFFGFESLPDGFEEYFNYMLEHEVAVLAMIYVATPYIYSPADWIVVAMGSKNEYANLDKSQKRELLMEVYNKFV